MIASSGFDNDAEAQAGMNIEVEGDGKKPGELVGMMTVFDPSLGIVAPNLKR
ncbi:hypothetical protein ACIP1U_20700 [Cupriavidus sp. NPDC089707]|uniref:hypothetical protein n=1 Tax=Cupriavidus sp. NPDC089707 TaxID=3363963 RepID=UPI00380C29CB